MQVGRLPIEGQDLKVLRNKKDTNILIHILEKGFEVRLAALRSADERRLVGN